MKWRIWYSTKDIQSLFLNCPKKDKLLGRLFKEKQEKEKQKTYSARDEKEHNKREEKVICYSKAIYLLLNEWFPSGINY